MLITCWRHRPINRRRLSFVRFRSVCLKSSSCAAWNQQEEPFSSCHSTVTYTEPQVRKPNVTESSWVSGLFATLSASTRVTVIERITESFHVVHHLMNSICREKRGNRLKLVPVLVKMLKIIHSLVCEPEWNRFHVGGKAELRWFLDSGGTGTEIHPQQNQDQKNNEHLLCRNLLIL